MARETTTPTHGAQVSDFSPETAMQDEDPWLVLAGAVEFAKQGRPADHRRDRLAVVDADRDALQLVVRRHVAVIAEARRAGRKRQGQDDAELQHAWGSVATPAPVGPYDLISLDAAVERLNDGRYGFGFPSGPQLIT